jgi:hypothetical protein
VREDPPPTARIAQQLVAGREVAKEYPTSERAFQRTVAIALDPSSRLTCRSAMVASRGAGLLICVHERSQMLENSRVIAKVNRSALTNRKNGHSYMAAIAVRSTRRSCHPC